ncbi:MAG: DNA-remodelling primosomal-like protein [Paenibacillus sp.]|jgi:DNA replication protein|nr:DNA-remodelling primosomal-like protein [Paenibacillus sp.]
MRREEQGKWALLGLTAALREGSVAIPALLLQSYSALKLSETEVMLLIHLIAFREKEGKEFPTLDELESRMSAPPAIVAKAMQRLVQQQFIQIDEEIDPVTGVLSEKYNLLPLYKKLAVRWTEQRQEEQAQALQKSEADKDIFSVFEKEFARPLTPMECETISQWIDQDHYPQPLILAALKESVFAGKLHFRYVDRILLEWSRNRVFTLEQAREYTQNFRGGRSLTK